MATVNTVTDKYVLEASVEDNMGPAVDRLSAQLGAFEKQAISGSEAAQKLRTTTADVAGQFSEAADQFDRTAQRYEAVTKAADQLAAGQRLLEQTQIAARQAVAENNATQEQADATIAALVIRVNGLATKLGEQRSILEANAESNARWNALAGEGKVQIEGFAAGVADAAQAARTAKVALDEATAAQEKLNAVTSASFAALDKWTASSNSQRASIDSVFASSQKYNNQIETLNTLMDEGVIGLEKGEAIFAELTEAFSAANQPLSNFVQTQKELNAVISASFAALESYGDEMTALRASIDPLFAVSQRYAGQLEAVDLLFARGLLTTERAATLTEELTAAYAAANQPLANITAGQTELAAVIQASFAALEQYTSGLDAMRASIDPIFASSKRYEESLASVATLLDAGKINSEQAKIAIAALGDAFSAANQPLSNFTDTQRSLEEVTRASFVALEQYRGGMDALRASVDPIFASSKRYEESLTSVAELLKVGDISADQARVIIERLTDAFSAANQPLSNLTEEQKKLDAANKATAASLAQYANQMDALRGTIDPIFASSKQYEASLSSIAVLLDAGKITTEQARLAIANLTAAFSAANQPLSDLVANEKALDEVVRASFAGLEQYTAGIAAQRGEFDKAFAINQRYADTITRIRAAVTEAGLSEALATRATRDAGIARDDSLANLDKAAGGTKELGASAGQAGFAARQASVQFTQFVSSVYSGQPIMLSAIQQGHQMIDVALATGTGFGVLKDAIVSTTSAVAGWIIANPMLAGLAALAIASGTLLKITQDQAVELRTLQQEIRGTSDNYVALASAAQSAARAVASTSNISLSDAKTATASIAKAPGFEVSGVDIAALTKIAGDASVAMGETVPAATAKFAAAIHNVAPLVSEFASKEMFGMNAEFSRLIKLQVDSGDASGAFIRAIDQIKQSSQGALQPATALGKAWEDLKNAFIGTDGSRGVGSLLGDAISAWAQTALRLVRELVNAINWIKNNLPGGGAEKPDVSGAPTLVPGGPLPAGATGVGLTPWARPGEGGALMNPSSTALGLGQLTQATQIDVAQFAQRPLDFAQAQDNIEGTFLRLVQLSQKLNRFGDQAFPTINDQLGAYKTGPNKDPLDPSVQSARRQYVSDVNAADPSKLPSDTAALIDKVATLNPAFANLADTVKHLVEFESKGIQFYNGIGIQPPGVANPLTSAAARSVAQTNADQINRAENLTQDGQIPTDSAAKAAAQVTLMESGLKALGDRTTTNADQFDRFTQRLDQAKLALQNAIPATDQQGRAIDKQTVAAQLLTEAYGQNSRAVAEQQAKAQATIEIDQTTAKTAGDYNAKIIERTAQILALNTATASTDSAKTLADDRNRLQSIIAITEASKQGDAEKAQAIAFEAARQTIDAKGVLVGQARTDAINAEAASLLKLSQASGVQTIEFQAQATDRATAATVRGTAALAQSFEAAARKKIQTDAEIQAINAGLTPGTDAYTASVNRSVEAVTKQQEALGQEQVQSTVTDLNNTTDAQDRLNLAILAGPAAIEKEQIAASAVAQLQKTVLIPGTLAYAKAYDDLVAARTKSAISADTGAGDELARRIAEETRQVKFETDSLGGNADARTLMIQHMQAEVQIHATLKEAYDKEGPALLAATDALNANKLALQNSQASLSFISSQFTQSFDTIGNAMAQAFIQGQGAAVNWANVMKSVVQQVIQAFLKLSVLNPILNSLTGSNSPTLLSVASAIGGGGSNTTVANSDGTFSLVSNTGTVLSTASSISGLAGGPTIGSTLGLTGPGGLFTGVGNSISSSLFGTAGSGVVGGVAPAGTEFALDGSLISTATGAVAPETATAGTSGLLSSGGLPAGLGSAIGSVALGASIGFAAGSVAGGLVQSSLNKTGPAPTIGAGVGAIGGAIIGQIVIPIPGVGALIGGLVGGLLGGAGGGLIGPHVQNQYGEVGITANNGQLGIGTSFSQREDITPLLQATQTEINSVNALLTQHGASVVAPQIPGDQFTAPNTILQLGNDLGVKPGSRDGANLDDAFSKLRFSSTDPDLNAAFQDRSFVDGNAFQAFLQTQDQWKAFVASTTSLMKGLGVTTGSVADAIASLNSNYTADIAAADAMIATGNLSADQTAKLIEAEANLTSIRDQNTAAVNAAAAAQVLATDQTLTSRLLNANATISGSPLDTQTAQLYAFDINATAERLSFANSFKALFGDAYLTTAAYGDQVNMLEKTQAAERLVIITTANKAILANDSQTLNTIRSAYQQAQASAATFVSSLRAFAIGLDQGAQSILSPLDKLRAAQATFAVDQSKAAGGDTVAMGNLQTDAQALLAAGQAYFGSSGGYVAIFQEVQDAIKTIADTSADALTADFFAAQTQSQTQTLVDALTALRQAVGLIGAAAPGASLDRLTNDNFVSGLYQSALGRAPDAGGLATFSGGLSSGLLTTDQVRQDVGNSPEAQTRIVALYQSELGRAPDPAGLANWQAALASGALTLAKIKTAIDNSPEGIARSSEHHAAGGWVGNGVWNHDSVSATLAGGEYVVSAPAAAKYADLLPQINASAYRRSGANDNGAAMLAELRALRQQAGTASVMEIRAQTTDIVGAIASLRAEMAALRAEANHRANRPGRLAG
jgi:uncharacterized protein DUF4214